MLKMNFFFWIVISFILIGCKGCVLPLIVVSNEVAYRERLVHAKEIQVLEDQETLIYFAKNDDSQRNRKCAVKKIENQDVLLEIAQDEKEDICVRLMAVQNLVSQENLSELVRMNSWEEGVYLIRQKLEKHTIHSNVRIAGIQKIEDKDVLYEIVSVTRDDAVHLAALERLYVLKKVDAKVEPGMDMNPLVCLFLEFVKETKDTNLRARARCYLDALLSLEKEVD